MGRLPGAHKAPHCLNDKHFSQSPLHTKKGQMLMNSRPLQSPNFFFFFPMNWYIFTCTLLDENSLILPALFSHCARGQPMLAPSRDFCSGPEVLFIAQPQLFRHPSSTSSHQVARQWQFTPNTNNISASHQIIVDNQPVYANTANSANAPYG